MSHKCPSADIGLDMFQTRCVSPYRKSMLNRVAIKQTEKDLFFSSNGQGEIFYCVVRYSNSVSFDIVVTHLFDGIDIDKQLVIKMSAGFYVFYTGTKLVYPLHDSGPQLAVKVQLSSEHLLVLFVNSNVITPRNTNDCHVSHHLNDVCVRDASCVIEMWMVLEFTHPNDVSFVIEHLGVGCCPQTRKRVVVGDEDVGIDNIEAAYPSVCFPDGGFHPETFHDGVVVTMDSCAVHGWFGCPELGQVYRFANTKTYSFSKST